ncbi:MAG: hypothetical protein IIC25_02190 [Chloroflexi bacterium]|nr:hypothetical protein [Chloroflexota bacterium]
MTVGLAVLAVLTVASAAMEQADADHEITGYPDSIAGLGDSITRAVNSDALGDRPENSWVTGTNASVDSIYSRLLAVHPAIAGNRFNEAVSGARMTDLNSQAQNAVAAGAELVMVFMGANDVCTPSESSMTPVATFQAQFETAMATLASGLPDARIAVLTIPDIHNLWAIQKDNATARFIWAFASICQSMLSDPLSNDAADVQRRANVRQRNMEFNDVLSSVCAEYVHCEFDDYLGFNTAFTPAHVSTIDYFHPSLAGQALIAQLVWDNALPDYTPSPTATPTPTPTATPVGQTPSPTPTPTPVGQTPSPTPTASPAPTGGQSVTWADNNCKDGVNPVDSLFVLRGDAGLSANTNECPPMGASIEVLNASQHTWGDVDCKDGMTPVDSLKILRYDAGLSVSQEAGCPAMASMVTITEL